MGKKVLASLASEIQSSSRHTGAVLVLHTGRTGSAGIEGGIVVV